MPVGKASASPPAPSSPPSPPSPPPPAIGLLQQYRQHRELLLWEVVAFVDALTKIETRLVARFKSSGWQPGLIPVAPPGTFTKSSKKERVEPELAEALAPLLQRNEIERAVDRDDEAVAFERAWRVLIVAEHRPDLGLSFADDHFLEPIVSTDDPHRRRRGKAWPGRFVAVDREAGTNAIGDALTKTLKNRPKGEVSRLPSKPPFKLRAGYDHVTEDIEIVRTCANGDRPDDFDEVIVNKLYENVARAAGWKRGRRLPKFASVAAAQQWNQLVRHVRQRWEKLERVLGPFPDSWTPIGTDRGRLRFP